MNFDAELDLHGFNLKTSAEVEYFVKKFVDEAYENGHKSIRIITGRGEHSKTRPLVKPCTESVLKIHPKVDHYRLDPSLGAFEIWLIN